VIWASTKVVTAAKEANLTGPAARLQNISGGQAALDAKSYQVAISTAAIPTPTDPHQVAAVGNLPDAVRTNVAEGSTTIAVPALDLVKQEVWSSQAHATSIPPKTAAEEPLHQPALQDGAHVPTVLNVNASTPSEDGLSGGQAQEQNPALQSQVQRPDDCPGATHQKFPDVKPTALLNPSAPSYGGGTAIGSSQPRVAVSDAGQGAAISIGMNTKGHMLVARNNSSMTPEVHSGAAGRGTAPESPHHQNLQQKDNKTAKAPPSAINQTAMPPHIAATYNPPPHACAASWILPACTLYICPYQQDRVGIG
jgi:hypothetical protein